MASGKFVSYFRVSTARQGASGLGLEAQQKAVADYLNGGNWSVLASFIEIESGRKNDRAELAKALAHCRLTGAILVIAKLDRLARDACFLLGLQQAGVEFVAADMPFANRLTVGIMALVAEEEAKAISARTTAALAASKARGTKLGGWRGGPKVDGKLGAAAGAKNADAFADSVRPTIHALKDEGLSWAAIVASLTAQEIKTARGKPWGISSVRNVMARA